MSEQLFGVDYASLYDLAQGLAAAQPPAPPPPAPEPLSCTLDFGSGGFASFSGGVDQGDFVGEFVHQKCLLATNPFFPNWRVYFRPDADGTRDEVVVEYGHNGPKGSAVNILTSFTFTVTKGTTVVYQATVPNIYWYSRFRYQSAPRPVVRTGADLIRRGWLPKYGLSGLFGSTGPTYAAQWPGPMGALPVLYNAALQSQVYVPYWRSPGERDDIGPLPEPAAACVIFGHDKKPDCWTSTLTGAEWIGNAQIHIRNDDGTMPAVRDLTTFLTTDGGTATTRINVHYANGSFFDQGPNYPAVSQGGNVAGKAVYPNWICLESGEAHWPAWVNLPWMMTEDPFFAEELQFSINWRILNNAPGRIIEKLPGLTRLTQTRTMAWSLRDISCAAKTMPATPPKWLQPQSYFRAVLDDHLTLALRCVNHPAKIYQTFRAWPLVNNPESWMQAWVNTIVGQMVSMGFAEWKPVLEWGMVFHLQMMSGTAWNRQWCMPYSYSPLTPSATTASELNNGLVYPSQITAKYDARTRTLAESWQAYKTGDRIPVGLIPSWEPGGKLYLADGQYPYRNPNFHLDESESGWDGTTLIQPDYAAKWHLSNTADVMFYYTNYLHARSALAVAVTHGVTGAKTVYDWFAPQLPGIYASYGPSKQKKYGRCAFSIDP